ncbi:LOW QUALITY PROTEIN: hypothetical protein RTBOTA2_000877 [Rhodotorula toruloides]|nr:LOW QUALITY PROTEIN: hypothetical protein RTBOTA2_000877 [Rhodotorula toruloides]
MILFSKTRRRGCEKTKKHLHPPGILRCEPLEDRSDGLRPVTAHQTAWKSMMETLFASEVSESSCWRLETTVMDMAGDQRGCKRGSLNGLQ